MNFTLGFPPHQTLLLIIDVQEKLVKAMTDFDACRKRLLQAVRAAAELGVEIMVSEQYPDGLGGTIPELREALPPQTPTHAKTAFSCWGCPPLAAAMQAGGWRCLVLAGMETHVCVQQTALGALKRGSRVAVLADAVISRDENNRRPALELMRHEGAVITTVEAMVFDWMIDASHPRFKAVSKLFR